VGLSVDTIVERTHGIYRAKTDADRNRRQSFTEELFHDVMQMALSSLPSLDLARPVGSALASPIRTPCFVIRQANF
jgi:hypothetical protein